MTIMTTNGYSALNLNPKDAVFGRGRKRDTVRKGSLYRRLIETYWKPYSNLDTSKFAMRRAFVKKKILDALIHQGGRFIVRAGEGMFLLDPNDHVDLKLIYKKVQRALFNEKKRHETKMNRKFCSKKLVIGWGDDDDDDDLEDYVAPAVSGRSADEDDGIRGDDDEDEYSESEDDFVSEDITSDRTNLRGRTVPTVSPAAKRVSLYEEDDWDFKAVHRVQNSMMMDGNMMPSVSFEWPHAESSDDEDSALTEEAMTIVSEVKEKQSIRSRSNSAVKLDKLAELACSLLFSEEDDDAVANLDAKKLYTIVQKAKMNPAAAFKGEGLCGCKEPTAFLGQENEKLAVIATDWDTLDKESVAIVEDDTGALKRPDPPASAFTGAFTVTPLDSSKPLKKRAYHIEAGGTMEQHISFGMTSCSTKPRALDFDQYLDERLFGSL
jgi:hypothetical protein